MYIWICCIVKHLYFKCYVSDYSTYCSLILNAFDESTERFTVTKNDERRGQLGVRLIVWQIVLKKIGT